MPGVREAIVEREREREIEKWKILEKRVKCEYDIWPLKILE